MSSELVYLVNLKPIEFDTILALVNEKVKILRNLPLKRRKQLNVMYGENYMNDYENCLCNLLKKFEDMRFNE